MSANLENSAVATGLEKVSLIPIPKKGNAKECLNYRTIVLISHASKEMSTNDFKTPTLLFFFSSASQKAVRELSISSVLLIHLAPYFRDSNYLEIVTYNNDL